MQRKIDILRIRKNLLPKNVTENPAKGESALNTFTKLVKNKNKNTEIEETKDSLIIWETVEE